MTIPKWLEELWASRFFGTWCDVDALPVTVDCPREERFA